MDPISVVSMVLSPLLGTIFGGTPDRLKGTPLPTESESKYQPEFVQLPGAQMAASRRMLDPGPGAQFVASPVSLSGSQLAAASMFPEQERFNVGEIV